MKNWLIVGAMSGIATPLARELSARGCRLYLAGREASTEALERLAQDIEVRHGAEVMTGRFEALEMERHEAFVDEVEEAFGPLNGVVWAVGVMEPQGELERDFTGALRQHAVNYVAAMGVLGRVAEKMESRRRGHIVAIGSPAGDRGRKSNYLYGADKAALHTFLEGLRNRLAGRGVTVLTVKPGPTDTPMTAGKKNLPMLARPADVARDIARAIDRGDEVLYTPWQWQYIMLVIRHLPRWIFKRLRM